MKQVIFLLLMILSVVSFSQSDSTTFSNNQVLRISNKIIELQQKDSINDLIITEYKTQISYYKAVQLTDSMMMVLKNRELELTNTKVELYKDLAKLNKPKWWERKFPMFISGMGTVWLTLYVYTNTL